MSYSRSPRALRSMTVGIRGMKAIVLWVSVNALELISLSKRYDDGLLALDGFDLEIPEGAFFGLLGPNGAGKTTLISAVCNLIRVTGGEIAVFGHDHASLEA